MTVIAVCSFTTYPETDCHSGPQMLQQFVRTREAPTLEQHRKRVRHGPRRSRGRSRAVPSPPVRNRTVPPRRHAHPSPQLSQTPATKPQNPARDKKAFNLAFPTSYFGARLDVPQWTCVICC